MQPPCKKGSRRELGERWRVRERVGETERESGGDRVREREQKRIRGEMESKRVEETE